MDVAVLAVAMVISGVSFSLFTSRGTPPDSVPHPFSPDDHVRILPPGSYDSMKARVVADAISALCQSPDFKTARLVVAEFELPISYAWLSPWVRKKYRRTGSNDPAVIVTPAFLDMGLEDHEFEAVAADVLTQLLYNPLGLADTTHFAKKTGFSDEFVRQMKSEFPMDYMVVMTRLIQDVYAARLITQPQALKTAMEKSIQVLNQTPVRSKFAGMKSFVDPPMICSGNRTELLTMPDILKAQWALAVHRDRLNELRLWVLELMEQGTRQPHVQLRDSKPITAPEGWE